MGRAEVTWASPAIRRSSLTIGGQIDGFSNAVGAAVVDQWRQNAAVSGSSTNIRERDIAGLVRIVGNQQDVILSGLGIIDVAVFSGGGTIAAVHHIAAR